MKEVWKDIEGYEGIYQISNTGRVGKLKQVEYIGNGFVDITNGYILEANSTVNKGAKIIGLTKNKITRTFQIHKLVAKYFIDNPENKPLVIHIDGDKTNNFYQNLKYITYSEFRYITHKKRKSPGLAVRSLSIRF